MAFDQSAYVNQYNKDNYSSITIYIPKGKKQVIKERSAEIGISVREMIYRSLEQQYHIKFSEN